jgi:hypothetical protein
VKLEHGISLEWLASLSPDARAAYVEALRVELETAAREVRKVIGTGSAWGERLDDALNRLDLARGS